MIDKDEEFGLDAISPATIFVSGKAISEQDALDAVHNVLKELNDNQDLDKADQTEDTLLGLQRISGKALASLLYGKKVWWDGTGQEKTRECTFEDYERSRHGLRRETIDRYICVWDKMQSFPEQFQARPLRDLIPVAKAIEQGYEISESVWKKLITATSNAEIISLVREKIKGKAARKSAHQLKMERDGSIQLWIGSASKFVGYLDVKSDDADVKKAVARILAGSGITRR